MGRDVGGGERRGDRVVRAEPARIAAARQASDPHLHCLDGRALLGPDEADDLTGDDFTRSIAAIARQRFRSNGVIGVRCLTRDAIPASRAA